MNKRLPQICLFFLTVNCYAAFTQKPPVIKLNNPSFEDFPQPGKTVQGWFDCGFAGETPPDVQPGSFKVNKLAAQGTTYLGLVVRDNNTWESVSQRLSSPIMKGVHYKFSLHLCRSDSYVSPDRVTNRDVNFMTPIIIRIWGGSNYCGKEELLSETPPINNTDWKEYKLDFLSKISHGYLMIEAFYKVPTLFPYNGNVLVDAASDIVPIVKDPPLIASTSGVKNIKKTNPTPPKPPKQPDTSKETPIATTEPKPSAPAKSPPTKPEPALKEGQIIKMEKVQFEATSAIIKEGSTQALDEAVAFLSNNPNVVVEIGGHTNDLPPDEECFKLSNDRAKAVADYLVAKGIDHSRVQFRGYGKLRPIADNRTPEGRKQNQRVEIKIVSVNG